MLRMCWLSPAAGRVFMPAGPGGLIENVLTRTAFSQRTGGWDLSHLQEIAALAGYRSPRCAAGAHCPDAVGAVRCLAVGGCTPRESRCVRVAGPCCRSLPAPGMDCGQAGLSQSDSRLGDVELTEFDSTTILSVYDST